MLIFRRQFKSTGEVINVKDSKFTNRMSTDVSHYDGPKVISNGSKRNLFVVSIMDLNQRLEESDGACLKEKSECTY